MDVTEHISSEERYEFYVVWMELKGHDLVHLPSIYDTEACQ